MVILIMRVYCISKADTIVCFYSIPTINSLINIHLKIRLDDKMVDVEYRSLYFSQTYLNKPQFQIR